MDKRSVVHPTQHPGVGWKTTKCFPPEGGRATLLVIRILPDGSFEEIYNGPGSLVWQQFEGERMPSNGQFQISVNRLRQLNELVPIAERVPQIN